MIDLLYDATDIDTSYGLVQVLVHDNSIAGFLKSLAEHASFDALPFKKSVKNALRWIRRYS